MYADIEFLGLFLPLRSVMLIDYVGLEKLTSAMGFIFTIQGLGCFVGIPIAGTNLLKINYYLLYFFFI